MDIDVCRQCDHQLVARAVRCSNCGALIEQGEQEFLRPSLATVASNDTEKVEGSSNVLPFWKYFLLIMSTFGIYEFWWFYRTWKFLRHAHNKRLGKDLQDKGHGFWVYFGATVGTALPIVNLFFTWNLFSGVQKVAIENNLPPRYSVKWLFLSYHLLILASFVFGFIVKGLQLRTGPDCAYMKISDLAFAVAPLMMLYFVQKQINDYWRKYQPNLPVRLTRGPIILTVIGVCLWALGSWEFYQIWLGQVDFNGDPVSTGTNVEVK